MSLQLVYLIQSTSACWKWAKTETSGIQRSRGTEQNLDCPQDNLLGPAPQELQAVIQVSLPELFAWYNKTDL